MLDIDYIDELNEEFITQYKRDAMDKKIKALQKSTKSLEKKESSLLKMDKKNDKIVDKAKKKMKGKC
jgi:hypothetical protein